MQIPPIPGAVHSRNPTTPGGPAGPAKTARDEFLSWVHKSSAEQMRAEILGSMGLDEDKLKAMDPKKRQEIEEKIKQLIHQKVEQDVEKKKGLVVDVKV